MFLNFPSIPGNDWSDVMALADPFAKLFQCQHIVCIGSDAPELLVPLTAKYQIHQLEHDPESDNPLAVADEVLGNAVIVCLDGTGRLYRQAGIMQSLSKAMDLSPVALVATPMHQGNQDVHQWRKLLQSQGLHIEFAGLTTNNRAEMKKQTMLAVVGNNTLKNQEPGYVRVAAILTAFNEEDIVYWSIQRLLDQGIFVYVVENWSTDSTYQIVRGFEGHPHFLGCERFPPEGPTNVYNWKVMLNQIADISRRLDVDWFIHHDIDEIRESPWPEKGLREAIAYADRMGFNAIDHTLIEFFPIDNEYASHIDFKDYFRFFDYGKKESDFIQVKAWKRTSEIVNLSDSGGHEAAFPGRRIFPYKFLSRHYPYRSQAHAEKKIFRDRKSRYDPGEVALGFHYHYAGFSEGDSFLHNPLELMDFDNPAFHTHHLVERLSGIGAHGARQAGIAGELPEMPYFPGLEEPVKESGELPEMPYFPGLEEPVKETKTRKKVRRRPYRVKRRKVKQRASRRMARGRNKQVKGKRNKQIKGKLSRTRRQSVRQARRTRLRSRRRARVRQ